MQRATIDWIWGLQLWEHCCCQVPPNSSAPSVASEQEPRTCCEYPAIYKSALSNCITLLLPTYKSCLFQFVLVGIIEMRGATQKKLLCAWISRPWKFTFCFKVHLICIFSLKKYKFSINFLSVGFKCDCLLFDDLAFKHCFLLSLTYSLQ